MKTVALSPKVVDITNDSVVICLTGVPHYITDATITMLVSTFGISIGEVERRFYKGIDTGERFVRLKPRARTQIPDFVTVGGCKILIRVIQPDEVIQPFTLQSIEGLGDCGVGAAGSGASMPVCSASSSTSNNLGNGPKSRAKPGHCNGVMNSAGNGGNTNGAAGGNSGSGDGGSGGINTFGGMTDLQTSRTEMLSTGCTGLTFAPLCASSYEARDDASTSGATRREPSPKIGKSLASRISSSSMIKTSSSLDRGDEVDFGAANTYLPGDPLDIPTLSPPPYKAPGSSSAGGSTSGSIANGGGGGRHGKREHGSENGFDAKSGSQQSGSGLSGATNGLAAGAGSAASSVMQKYSKVQSTFHRSKTDSSTSLTSSLAGKSTEALKDGSGGGNKRSSGGGVMFEDDEDDDDDSGGGAAEDGGGGRGDKSHRSRTSKSSSKGRAGILNQKTVNGILRKGSGPGDEPVPQDSGGGKRDKKSRKRDGHHKHKSKSRTRLEAVSEGAGGGGGGGAGSGSGSDKEGAGSKEKVPLSKAEARELAARKADAAKKANKANKDSKELKHQKDLALTRDLPWCGCWGNGCL